MQHQIKATVDNRWQFSNISIEADKLSKYNQFSKKYLYLLLCSSERRLSFQGDVFSNEWSLL